MPALRGGNWRHADQHIRLDVRRNGKIFHRRRGIDEMAHVIESAFAAGALDKSGSHLPLDRKSIGQGREGACEALLSEPELRARQRAATLSLFLL